MTTVPTTQSHATALLAGQLAIVPPCHHDNPHTRALMGCDESPCHPVCRSLPTARHLLPIVGPPPVCSACGGSGLSVMDGRIATRMDGSLRACPDCSNGLKVTLTVECEQCDGSGKQDQCGPCAGEGERPIATAVVEKALRIVHPDDEINRATGACVAKFRSHLYLCTESVYEPTVISHLLAVADFEPGGYALLLRDVGAHSST